MLACCSRGFQINFFNFLFIASHKSVVSELFFFFHFKFSCRTLIVVKENWIGEKKHTIYVPRISLNSQNELIIFLFLEPMFLCSN